MSEENRCSPNVVKAALSGPIALVFAASVLIAPATAVFAQQNSGVPHEGPGVPHEGDADPFGREAPASGRQPSDAIENESLGYGLERPETNGTVQTPPEFLWSGSISTRNVARPLVTDFKRFEAFLKSHWDVVEWRFEDWRETPRPAYRFEVDMSRREGFEGISVRGFIPQDGRVIQFEDDGNEYFTLDFLRAFCDAFPDQRDNIALFNEQNDVAMFDPALDDATLLGRIRLDNPVSEAERTPVIETQRAAPVPDRPAATPGEMAAMDPTALLSENALYLLAWGEVWPPSHDGDMTSYVGPTQGPWPNVAKPIWQKPLEVSQQQQAEMASRSALLRRDAPMPGDLALRGQIAEFLRLAFPQKYAEVSKQDLDDWIAVRFEEARSRGFGDDEALVYWPVAAAIAGENFPNLPFVSQWLQVEYLSRDDLLDRLLKGVNVTLGNPWIAALVNTVVEGFELNGAEGPIEDAGPDEAP